MEGIVVMIGTCDTTVQDAPHQYHEERRHFCLLCTTGNRRSPLWPATVAGLVGARNHCLEEHQAEPERLPQKARARTVEE